MENNNHKIGVQYDLFDDETVSLIDMDSNQSMGKVPKRSLTINYEKDWMEFFKLKRP